MDGKAYSLASGGQETLTLKPGRHELTLADGQAVPFQVTIHNRGGIINPSKSLHVIYGVSYLLEDSEGAGFVGLGSVLIDGVEYNGEIHTTDSVFIDNGVFLATYMVGEPFPDVITTTDRDASDMSVRKFFTKDEFVKFYESETQNPGHYEANKMDGGETTITNPALSRYPEYDFQNAELKAMQDRAREIIKNYQDADSTKKQKPFADEFYALLQELNNIRPEDPQDREKRDLFQDDLSAALRAGIVPAE